MDEGPSYACRVGIVRSILRNALKMFAHSFRGNTIRTFLGLEDEHRAFERFRMIPTVRARLSLEGRSD